MRRFGAQITLILIGISGCLAVDEDDSKMPGADHGAVPTQFINFTIRAGTPNFIYNNDDEANGGNFEVPANSSSFLAEAMWTCSMAECRMFLVLRDTSGGEHSRTEGDGEASQIVHNPRSGTWNAAMLPNGIITDVKGRIAVTVFVGGEIPEGHSAFDAGASTPSSRLS